MTLDLFIGKLVAMFPEVSRAPFGVKIRKTPLWV